MSREPASYVCPSCGARSYHPRDREDKYCGRCHLFEDEDPMHSLGAPADRRRLSAGRTGRGRGPRRARCPAASGSPPAAHRAEEFDCIECQRHIVRIVPMPHLGHLCGTCLYSPGWYRVPELRRAIDPDMTVPNEEPDPR